MPHRCTGCGRGFPDGSRQVLSGCPDCGGTTFQFLPDGGSVVEPDSGGDPVGGDGAVRDSTTGAGRVSGDGAAGNTDASAGVAAFGGDSGAAFVDAAASEDDAQTVARESLPGADRLLGDTGGDRTDSGDDERVGAPRGTDALDELDEVGAGDATRSAGRPADRATTDTVTDDAATADGSTVETATGETAPADAATTGTPAADDAPSDTASAAEVDAETVREELSTQFESIRIVAPGRYELNLMELYERDEHVIAVRENGRYVIDVAEARLDDE